MTPHGHSSARVDKTDSHAFPTADLKYLMEDHDATFSPSVTDECTHLVTTQKDVEKNTAKCKFAAFQCRDLALTEYSRQSCVCDFHLSDRVSRLAD